MSVSRAARVGAVGLGVALIWPVGLAVTAPPLVVPPSAAGAAPVGSTSYAVPAGAVFVVAQGATGGTGTQSSPYQSLATAISKAASGATLVLRGGTYHESVRVPSGKKLTIQSYPGEAVWLDGAAPVTGWVKSGSTWVVSNWNHLFDHRVSFGAGMDESHRYVDPAYPMAGYADAVWVGGTELTQVSSEAAVTAGTFYVDEANKRLVIGSDPTGKLVEASKLAKAVQIHGVGTTIRGIGVKRYAAHLALFGAVSYEVNDITFENVVIADNATLGVGGWGDNATFRNVTVSGNGMLGMHGDKAPGLRIVDSVITGNNDQRFKQEPVSGGIKLTDSDGVRIVGNTISSNRTIGLWFDVTMRNFAIVGNTVTQNSEGIEVELSGHGVIADNYIARNTKAGIFLFDTNDVKIWNNTLDTNSRSLQVLQDARRQVDDALTASVPWITSDIEFSNNVVAYGGETCPLLVQDLTGDLESHDFGLRYDGNAFHRSPSSSPWEFACWADDSRGTVRFPSLTEWTEDTSNDRESRLFEGGEFLRPGGRLVDAVREEAGAVPRSLPDDVAAAIGRPRGDRWLGAYLVEARSR